ncbi:MAG: hypothetical protein L0H83_10380 [Salinisphaera sp.]|nr:hypothetical protein [Salinisphaera sp.]
METEIAHRTDDLMADLGELAYPNVTHAEIVAESMASDSHYREAITALARDSLDHKLSDNERMHFLGLMTASRQRHQARVYKCLSPDQVMDAITSDPFLPAELAANIAAEQDADENNDSVIAGCIREALDHYRKWGAA